MTVYQIDPEIPMAEHIEVVRDAMLVPFAPRRVRRRSLLGGVLRADGSFVAQSHAYIEPGRTATSIPRVPDPETLSCIKGTWLYGGRHDLRFGHFLVETLARLWALAHVGVPVDGIVFLPQAADGYGRPRKRLEKTKALFDLMGDLPPIQILTQSRRFETLIVPPQGCGSGEHAVGTPEFRQFMKDRFATSVQPVGPEKIYLSRSRLIRTPGQILFEREIEQQLEREGYVLIHPQEHTVQEQIGLYRAAGTILGTEGSAFHLVAFATQNKKIGVIRRRFGNKADGFLDQLKWFNGREPASLGSVTESFTFPKSGGKANALLDMTDLTRQMRGAGFVSDKFDLIAPDAGAIEAEKSRLFARVFPDE